MDRRGYVEAAGLRFTEFGGFAPAEAEGLPRLVAEWADLVVEREEPGLLTQVLFVPLQAGSLLAPMRDQLVEALTAVAQSSRTEALGLLLLISEEPLSREFYDRVQQLTYSAGTVRVVPWIVDLAGGRLFGHEGPPFGLDPDLPMLASPAVERVIRQERRAEARRRRPGQMPWVTVGLAAIIVLVWVAMTLLGGSIAATESSEVLIQWGAALRPHLIEEGEYWRLFTAGFIHIGLAHLVMNTLSLWWVGQVVEALFGRIRMLLVYLIALVAGSVASLVLGPPIVLSAGASGAIFGLLGALLWYRLVGPERHRIQLKPLLVVLVINLGYGLIASQSVDNWNHLGGLIGGFLAAAAVGAPVRGGLPLARRLLNGVATLLLVAVSAATVAGAVELPGSSQRLVKAMSAWEAGRLDDAQKGLEAVVKGEPDDPRLQLALAWVYLDQGRVLDARSGAERVLALDPGNEGARELLQFIQRMGTGR